MFKVRVKLRPLGGWEGIPEEQQFDVSRDDELPYIPQIGSSYDFELPNKDLAGGTVARVNYYRHDKSTTVVVEMQHHSWDYEEFLKAGWKNE